MSGAERMWREGEEKSRERRTSGSPSFNPSCPRKNTITAWKRLLPVILNTLFFMMGAAPMDLKRTTTGHRQRQRQRVTLVLVFAPAVGGRHILVLSFGLAVQHRDDGCRSDRQLLGAPAHRHAPRPCLPYLPVLQGDYGRMYNRATRTFSIVPHLVMLQSPPRRLTHRQARRVKAPWC